MIVFLSTKTWHWHLTKQMKGLRSNGTPGNMIDHSTLSLDYLALLDRSDCDMPNGSNFVLFGQWGVLWVPMGAT